MRLFSRELAPTNIRPESESGLDGLVGKRTLVTGAEGFMGSHMAERLARAGAEVTALDKVPNNDLENLAFVQDRIQYIQSDLVDTDFDSLIASGRFEVIFHFAGNAHVPNSVSHPWSDFQANVVATLKLMESLRQSSERPKLILISSAAVYGDIESASISEEAKTSPISPYGVSKLAIDRYASVYARLYGLRIASLRPFSVYGPRLRKQVVYDLICKLSACTGTLEAHGDGTQVRDFCYVTDVVDAALAADRSGKLGGEVYNVASGEGCSIRTLIDLLCDQLGIEVNVKWTGSVRSGEPQRWTANVRRLKALGWQPLVPLDKGLRNTIAWFCEAMQGRCE